MLHCQCETLTKQQETNNIVCEHHTKTSHKITENRSEIINQVYIQGPKTIFKQRQKFLWNWFRCDHMT